MLAYISATRVRRWNPKSKPYVYDNRHGISIIDLEKTYDLLEKAAEAVEEVVYQVESKFCLLAQKAGSGTYSGISSCYEYAISA